MYWKTGLAALLCALFCAASLGCAGQGVYVAPAPAEEPTVEEMIGQMLLVGFRGVSTSDPEVRDVLELIRQGKIGGVIIFDYDVKSLRYGRNVKSPDQLKALCAALAGASKTPLFISLDQEGGRVQRLKPATGFKKWPSPKEMGQRSTEQAYRLGLNMGRELARAGFNLDFAPSVDVDVNPDSPAIGRLGRSFGADPALVTEKAGAFARGLNDAGLISCFKHFPGHGSSGVDTHEDLADVSSTWTEAELAPYRKLTAGPGRHMVMVGHLLVRQFDDKLPASLSPRVINGLLRRDLGWNGVVISDDLQMKAVSDRHSMEETVLMGIDAGMDILLFGNNLIHDPKLSEKLFETTLNLYRQGRISKERIRQSYDRIMLLKQDLGGV